MSVRFERPPDVSQTPDRSDESDNRDSTALRLGRRRDNAVRERHRTWRPRAGDLGPGKRSRDEEGWARSLDAEAEGRRRRRGRKALAPRRSAARFDPHFRGVSFVLQTKLTSDGESQLVVKSFFNTARSAKRQQRRRDSEDFPSDSFSDTDAEETALARDTELYPSPVKVCASCNTKKTPLWRDAEDGTPLCNACGIRYKKYRVRCSRCWHIPKKDDKTYPNCLRCGAILGFIKNGKI